MHELIPELMGFLAVVILVCAFLLIEVLKLDELEEDGEGDDD